MRHEETKERQDKNKTRREKNKNKTRREKNKNKTKKTSCHFQKYALCFSALLVPLKSDTIIQYILYNAYLVYTEELFTPLVSKLQAKLQHALYTVKMK